jgi:hypothetical protein
MDAAPGVTRGSAEEVRVSGRRANGVQARCITAAPRPCRLCRSHDAVQAQHAALGERASPIAVRLKTSPVGAVSSRCARYQGRAIQLPVRVSLEIGPAAH